MYIIAQHSGGFTLGAFSPEEQLLGFLNTLPAIGDGNKAIYYSHMLGIAPEFQDNGIGYALKLRQREEAIKNNIPLIRWTFDPLQSRNGHFNINKLGCVVRKYKVNFYGAGASTIFDAGIEADRLIAEWWVASRRVENALSRAQDIINETSPFVEVPLDFAVVRARNLEEANQWRSQVREEFQKLLDRNLVCTGFIPGSQSRLSRYCFSPWQFEPYNDKN